MNRRVNNRQRSRSRERRGHQISHRGSNRERSPFRRHRSQERSRNRFPGPKRSNDRRNKSRGLLSSASSFQHSPPRRNDSRRDRSPHRKHSPLSERKQTARSPERRSDRSSQRGPSNHGLRSDKTLGDSRLSQNTSSLSYDAPSERRSFDTRRDVDRSARQERFSPKSVSNKPYFDEGNPSSYRQEFDMRLVSPDKDRDNYFQPLLDDNISVDPLSPPLEHSEPWQFENEHAEIHHHDRIMKYSVPRDDRGRGSNSRIDEQMLLDQQDINTESHDGNWNQRNMDTESRRMYDRQERMEERERYSGREEINIRSDTVPRDDRGRGSNSRIDEHLLLDQQDINTESHDGNWNQRNMDTESRRMYDRQERMEERERYSGREEFNIRSDTVPRDDRGRGSNSRIDEHLLLDQQDINTESHDGNWNQRNMDTESRRMYDRQERMEERERYSGREEFNIRSDTLSKHDNQESRRDILENKFPDRFDNYGSSDLSPKQRNNQIFAGNYERDTRENIRNLDYMDPIPPSETVDFGHSDHSRTDLSRNDRSKVIGNLDPEKKELLANLLIQNELLGQKINMIDKQDSSEELFNINPGYSKPEPPLAKPQSGVSIQELPRIPPYQPSGIQPVKQLGDLTQGIPGNLPQTQIAPGLPRIQPVHQLPVEEENFFRPNLRVPPPSMEMNNPYTPPSVLSNYEMSSVSNLMEDENSSHPKSLRDEDYFFVQDFKNKNQASVSVESKDFINNPYKRNTKKGHQQSNSAMAGISDVRISSTMPNLNSSTELEGNNLRSLRIIGYSSHTGSVGRMSMMTEQNEDRNRNQTVASYTMNPGTNIGSSGIMNENMTTKQKGSNIGNYRKMAGKTENSVTGKWTGKSTIKWNIRPTNAQTEVFVSKKGGGTLFSACGTRCIIEAPYRGRIDYYGDTTLGIINFTLNDCSFMDEGVYLIAYENEVFEGPNLKLSLPVTEGETAVILWKMKKVPPNQSVIVHKMNGFQVFTAWGTMAQFTDEYRGRAEYFGDTEKGIIVFTIKNTFQEDAGIYMATAGDVECEGRTLVVDLHPQKKKKKSKFADREFKEKKILSMASYLKQLPQGRKRHPSSLAQAAQVSGVELSYQYKTYTGSSGCILTTVTLYVLDDICLARATDVSKNSAKTKLLEKAISSLLTKSFNEIIEQSIKEQETPIDLLSSFISKSVRELLGEVENKQQAPVMRRNTFPSNYDTSSSAQEIRKPPVKINPSHDMKIDLLHADDETAREILMSMTHSSTIMEEDFEDAVRSMSDRESVDLKFLMKAIRERETFKTNSGLNESLEKLRAGSDVTNNLKCFSAVEREQLNHKSVDDFIFFDDFDKSNRVFNAFMNLEKSARKCGMLLQWVSKQVYAAKRVLPSVVCRCLIWIQGHLVGESYTLGGKAGRQLAAAEALVYLFKKQPVIQSVDLEHQGSFCVTLEEAQRRADVMKGREGDVGDFFQNKWLIRVCEDIILQYLTEPTIENLEFQPGFPKNVLLEIKNVCGKQKLSFKAFLKEEGYINVIGKILNPYQILSILKRCGGVSGRYRLVPKEECLTTAEEIHYFIKDELYVRKYPSHFFDNTEMNQTETMEEQHEDDFNF